jgi:hypothetical protein
MGFLLAVMMLLPSRTLTLPPVTLVEPAPIDFDLVDIRDEERAKELLHKDDGEPHSIFIVKRHLGISAGYDNTIVHGGVGLYLTVAEWGRWNFGVPSAGIGFGRYPIYNRATQMSEMKEQLTVFVSLASLHYRVSRIESLGVTWYLNFEQVYDIRYSLAGSQFGVSFSGK